MMKTNQKSVMAFDRATYHTYLDKDDKRPRSSCNKAELADMIHRWDGIPDDWPLTCRTRKTKDEFLERAKESIQVLYASCKRLSTNLLRDHFT